MRHFLLLMGCRESLSVTQDAKNSLSYEAHCYILIIDVNILVIKLLVSQASVAELVRMGTHMK